MTDMAFDAGSLYWADHHAWLERQLALVRAGRLDALDLEHLAEELEAMTRRCRREIDSRLTILLVRLLTYHYQPEARCGSWRGNIVEHRQGICDALEDSPSLEAILTGAFNSGEAYSDAVEQAVAEMMLPMSAFPATCPYTLDQVMDPLFWPGLGPHPDLDPRERARLRLY